MNLLDRYIIRQFLINFAILLFVLVALFVLIDLVANLDEYLEAGRRVAAQRAGSFESDDATGLQATADADSPRRWMVIVATAWVIWDWHAPLSGLLYVYGSGLVVVGAMGFTFTDMARKGEMAAVLTSGISMYRIAAPVLAIGGVLNLLALPIQEFVIPLQAAKLARNHSQLGHPGIRNFEVRFAGDGEGNLISASSFDPDHQMLDRHVIILGRDSSGLPQYVITANQGVWNEQRGGWDLIDGYKQQPAIGSASPLDRADDELPRDVPAVSFFATKLSPQVLMARRAQIYPTLLSISQLKRLSKNNAIDTVQVTQIMHRRFSMLVVNMLVLIMGLPFFLGREPVVMLVQVVRAASLCVGAWTSTLVIIQLGSDQLSPVAAAWLPVVLYLPVSAWLMQRIKT